MKLSDLAVEKLNRIFGGGGSILSVKERLGDIINAGIDDVEEINRIIALEALSHTQNTDSYLNMPVSNVLYVDNKRTDTYYEDGSFTRPFKTIQAAHDAIPLGGTLADYYEINISSGKKYIEALTLSRNFMALVGNSTSRWCGLSGPITITSLGLCLQRLKISGAVTATMSLPFLLEVKQCSIGSGTWNVTQTDPTKISYFQIDGGVWSGNLNISNIKGGIYIADGAYYTSTWSITNSFFVMGGSQLDDVTYNFEAGTDAEFGGSLIERSTYNLKTGATLAADATALGTNTLNNTGGTLTLMTKGGDINNDSSVSGTTVKDALETLSGGSVPTKLGIWSATVDYVANDFVTYADYIYLCIGDSLNEQPDTHPSKWQRKEFTQVYPTNASFSGTYNGSIFVNGNFTMNSDNVTINGDLFVTGNINSLGTGGLTLTVKGDLFVIGSINLEGDITDNPNSGHIIVGGDFYAGNTISMKGQDSDDSVAPGNGGNITVGGYFYYSVDGELALYGGAEAGITAFDGGDGGDISAGKIFLIGEIHNYGGDASLSGGDGGDIVCYGDLFCESIKSVGGTSSEGNGGNGGNVTIYNDANFAKRPASFSNMIEIYGGDSGVAGNGGTGGNLYVHGDLKMRDTGSIGIWGGYVLTGSGNGGSAGSVTVLGDAIMPSANIYPCGGDAVDSGAGGNGNDITVKGRCTLREIWSVGGFGTATGNGGNGGSVSIGGDFTSTVASGVDLRGSIGLIGGNGGNFTCNGLCDAVAIIVNGGDSDPASSAGSCGVVNLINGGNIDEIDIKDGTVGIASVTTSKGLNINGTATIKVLDVENRAGVEIAVYAANKAAILFVQTFSSLNKLTNGVYGSGQTVSLTNTEEKLYHYNGDGDWYEHIGHAPETTSGTITTEPVGSPGPIRFAGLPVPDDNNHLAIAPINAVDLWVPAEIVSLKFFCNTTIAAGDASNHYEFNVTNNGVNMLASNYSLIGGLTAFTKVDIPVDPALKTVLGDTSIAGFIDMYDAVGGAVLTDLSAANLYIIVEYKIL